MRGHQALLVLCSQWTPSYSQVKFFLLLKASSRLSPAGKVPASCFSTPLLSHNCLELLQ